MTRPLTAAADPSRPIPAHTGERLDVIEIALTSLSNESRRLERLGFELPLARCHAQRRYWSFLQALYSLPTDMSSRTIARGADGESSWR
jgi:hypothetical protein